MKANGKTKHLVKSKRAVARKPETAVAIIRPLTASGLKEVLWETLLDVKQDQMMPSRADAIAGQAREILRTVKTQLQVAGQSKRGVPHDIIKFSET